MFDNLSIVVSWVQPGLGVFKDEGRRINLFYKFIFLDAGYFNPDEIEIYCVNRTFRKTVGVSSNFSTGLGSYRDRTGQNQST